jgi:hypothetical protein
MQLYYTDKMRGLQLADPKRGVGEWVEFTDQPLAGYGDATYIIEANEGFLKQWEFTGGEPNLIKGVRYFDIPARELSKFRVREDSYRRLTGREWNQWLVLLQAAHSDRAETTSLIWASREGIVTTNVFEKGGDQWVSLTLTDDFDPTEDYLILETRQYNGQKWSLEILVGVNPGWADYPAQWAEWVRNGEVQKSAIDFLKQQFPTLHQLIDMAAEERVPHNQVHGWSLIVSKIEQLTGRQFHIQGASRTSILAMPIKLAEKIGGWTPPEPRPEYIDPKASGRIRVAAPIGTGVILRQGQRKFQRFPNEIAV